MRMFDPTLINPNRNKDITSEDRAASRFGMRNSMEPPPKVFFDQALDYHFFGDIRRDGILKEGIDPAVDPFAAVVPGADPTLLTDMVGQFRKSLRLFKQSLKN